MKVWLVVLLAAAFCLVPGASATPLASCAVAQTQINEAALRGGDVVQLRADTYSCSTALVLKSGITLQGKGSATIIKTVGQGETGSITMTPAGTSSNAYRDITLRDLKVDSRDGHGMHLRNTKRLRVQNVEVTLTSSVGLRESLWIEYSRDVLVSGSYVHDVNGNGIQINASENFVVSGNTTRNTGDDAIDVDIDFLAVDPEIKSRRGVVSGNVIDTVTAGNGIRVEASDYITVTSNNISNTAASCIFVNSVGNLNGPDFTAEHIVVANNVLTDCRQAVASCLHCERWLDRLSSLLCSSGQEGVCASRRLSATPYVAPESVLEGLRRHSTAGIEGTRDCIPPASRMM